MTQHGNTRVHTKPNPICTGQRLAVVGGEAPYNLRAHRDPGAPHVLRILADGGSRKVPALTVLSRRGSITQPQRAQLYALLRATAPDVLAARAVHKPHWTVFELAPGDWRVRLNVKDSGNIVNPNSAVFTLPTAQRIPEFAARLLRLAQLSASGNAEPADLMRGMQALLATYTK